MQPARAVLICIVHQGSGSPHCVVELVGDLDMSTDSKLIDAVAGALAAFPDSLTLDLARLRFIDARGATVIAAAAKRAKMADARFRVIHAKPHVRKVMDLGGLHVLADGHIDDAPRRGSA
jgi:anti-anti-sigma factor